MCMRIISKKGLTAVEQETGSLDNKKTVDVLMFVSQNTINKWLC